MLFSTMMGTRLVETNSQLNYTVKYPTKLKVGLNWQYATTVPQVLGRRGTPNQTDSP
jgi:hypothetical protein